ncbi:MAG: papain-like cysteine protease family protein [Bacteroidota bacterium]
MKNRFLTLFSDTHKNISSVPRKHKPVSAHSTPQALSKKSDCPQMNETPVDEDTFVIDILAYFFGERLTPNQLNDRLREIAGKMLWTAVEASKRMDAIPHPPKGVPSPKWLVSEAVQIAFRVANNNCLYVAVKNKTAQNWKSAYEIARRTAGSMSVSTNYYSWTHTAVKYIIPAVPKLLQPSKKTCWATAITMMYSWKRKQSLKIEDFLNELKNKYFLWLFRDDVAKKGEGSGISREKLQKLYDILGLQSIAQLNPTISMWETYLKSYGPLKVEMAWRQNELYHAIIVYGIEGDGTSSGTVVYNHDPAGELPGKIPFSELLQLYENGADWPMQITHFPPNSQSKSFGLGKNTFASGLSSCALTTYKGANFKNEAVVDVDFLPAIKRIQGYAAKRQVTLYITSSFRPLDWKPKEKTVVTPARKSNHYAGHAIDMNVIYKGTWYNSVKMRKSNFPHLPESVKGFLADIRNDTELRWGGDFQNEDTVHIDDFLNANEANWQARVDATQAAHHAKCY